MTAHVTWYSDIGMAWRLVFPSAHKYPIRYVMSDLIESDECGSRFSSPSHLFGYPLAYIAML